MKYFYGKENITLSILKSYIKTITIITRLTKNNTIKYLKKHMKQLKFIFVTYIYKNFLQNLLKKYDLKEKI